MSECSFCGSIEKTHYPVCYSCGTLRYTTNPLSTPTPSNNKLKVSAAVIGAIITPGAFIVLAVIGVNRLHSKLSKP